MKNFIFNKIPRIYFGEDCLEESLIKEINNIGNNVMIIYGKNSIKEFGIYERIIRILKEHNKRIIEFNGIMSNPTYKKVLEGIKVAKESNVDFILAIGGGSVIDSSKIISVGACTNDDIWYLEKEQGKNPTKFIPLASIVTASGTGSEVNNKGVITNEDKKIKCSLIGSLPEFTILDPALTLTVPKRQVIAGAFDTLSHLMETYFGKPLEDNVSDDIIESLMKNLIRNIRLYLENPTDIKVRGELMWVSTFAMSGIPSLGKITDFQCHQIEHQLGAYTDCIHAEGLAIIHPILYRHIYKNGVDKFVSFAKNVWNISDSNRTQEEIALLGIDALEKFIEEIGLPTNLSSLNIIDKDILKKVAYSTNIKEGCMKQLSYEEILGILEECL